VPLDRPHPQLGPGFGTKRSWTVFVTNGRGSYVDSTWSNEQRALGVAMVTAYQKDVGTRLMVRNRVTGESYRVERVRAAYVAVYRFSRTVAGG
jgi:hypothetical protein